MLKVWLLIVAIGIAVYVIAEDMLCKRRMRARFAERKCLAREEVLAEFSSHSVSGEIVWRILLAFEHASGVPAGCFRPTDGFENMLAPPEWWGDTYVEDMQLEVGKLFKELGIRKDLSEANTLDDIVMIIERGLKKGAEQTDARNDLA